MPYRILLISDLHLEESRPDITASLLRFLEDNRDRCDALYVLGDLFEVWIGDDESSELTQTVSAAFKDFSQTTQLFFMHGNRDFLLGNDYIKLCGGKLIQEPYILETGSQSIVLVHGDCLCSDDVDYMKFRDMVRQQQWQQEFLGQTLEQRREFAREARKQSQLANANKTSSIMDVNQDEVEKLLRTAAKTTMIHGHTHRPASHQFTFDTDGHTLQATRVVLGDWDKFLWYGEVSYDTVELKQLPLSS